MRDVEQRNTGSQFHYYDTLLEGCQIIGFDWRYVYLNDAAVRLGRQPRESVIGRTVMECYPGIEQTSMFEAMRASMQSRVSRAAELEFVYPDGAKAWLECRVEPVPEGIFVLTLDVTERRQSEEHIRRLNRTLSVMSDINQAVLRQRHGEGLYQTICQIAVDKGDFEMAWIGQLDSVSRDLVPVAYAGMSAAFVEMLGRQLGADDSSLHPYSAALRAGSHVYSNDVETDPLLDGWRDLLGHSGCHSWATLPLMVEGTLRGILTLYAREPGFFGPEELRLVDEIATDISFAMAYAEQARQAEQHVEDIKRTEAALVQSEARFRSVVQDQTDLICRYDTDLKLTFANDAYGQSHDRRADEMIGIHVLSLIPPEERERAFAHVRSLTVERPVATSEHQSIMPDGSQRWFQWTDRALFDQAGQIVEYQGVGRDISERKLVEEAERKQRKIALALRNSLEALASSLDVKTVMNQILEQASNVVTYDAATITRFDGSRASVEYSRGHPPEIRARLTEFLNARPANALFGGIRAGEPYLIEDVEKSADWLPLADVPWIRSSLGVPIEVRGEVVGVLTLDSAQVNNYTQADLEPMRTFAQYAALALENALHTETLEQSVAERTAEVTREKERVEVILDNSTDGILLASGDLTIEHTNRAFDRMFGGATSEYIGRSVIDLVSPSHWERVVELVAATSGAQRANSVEVTAVRRDGSTFDVELSIGNTGKAGARGGSLVCTLHDITTMKARERQLRFHASLQENVTDAVVATSLDFRIQSWNRAAELVFGWKSAEVVGRHIDEVLPLASETLNRVRGEFRSKGYWTGEVTQHHRDGRTLHIQISLVLFRDRDGSPLGIVSVNRDITLRVQTEQALQAKNEQERELQSYLKHLHEINIELTQIDNLDQFYRRAVELALERFGFERFSLMLYDGVKMLARATYGTDLQGRVIAEHGMTFDPTAYTRILMRALEESERFCYDQDVPLYMSGEEVGRGWNAAAVLWNGTQSLGWLTADNAVRHRPASKAQLEILGLYSATLGTILAQKQAEDALRESEAKFRMLLEAAPIATVITDREGHIALINEQAEALFGYNREELMGQVVEVLVPHRDRLRHAENRTGYIAHPRRRPMGADAQIYAARKDGTLFPVEIDLSYVDTGAGILVLSFIIDITERVQAAAALEQQRVFLRRVIDFTPSMIFVKDYDGRFVLVNPVLARLYGTTPDRVIGKTDADFNPSAQEVAQFLESDRRVIDSGEVVFLEEPVTGRNGETSWFQTTKVPIVGEDSSTRYVLGVSTDITGRRKAEEALLQTLDKEKELGELKSRFVGIASHEFRTPLATILAVSETLSAYRQNMTDDQVELRLQKIREQVQHLTDIMDDVLQLARIQARRVEFNPVTLDIDALCRDIIDEFQSQRDMVHPLIYTCQPDSPSPKLDKKLMRQVINNLIANAIKYSPDGQPVHITLGHDDSSVYVQVQDEGIGIPEADMKHLFQPFHRAQNVGSIPGTGLGLTIIQESVKLHGGTIEIESAVGQGTTMTVVIPTGAK